MIEQRYELRGGALVLLDERIEVPRWGQAYYVARLPRLYTSFDHDGGGWSVFDDDRLVAIAVLDGRWMGADLDTLDLTFIHVSRELRGSGVGGELFDRTATLARERGAKRLYVSSSDSRATVDFYTRRGLRLADPPDAALSALEPTDVQLVLDLSSERAR